MMATKMCVGAIVSLGLAQAVLGNSCPAARGCNAPAPYSALTRFDTITDAYTIDTSVGFPDQLKQDYTDGIESAMKVLGAYGPVKVYMFGPGGSDPDYNGVISKFCTFLGRESDSQCGDDERTKAKAGTEGSFYASPKQVCMCDKGSVVPSVGVVFQPSTSELSSPLWGKHDLAVHEYTHAFQSAGGGYMAAWLDEGPATLMPCLLRRKLNPTIAETLTDIIKAEILGPAFALYNSKNVKWLELYGNDRPCTPANNPDFEPNNYALDHWRVFYQVGSVATLFMMKKAFLNNPQGRTHAQVMRDFWTAEGTKGFWRNIKPWDGIDLLSGEPSSVPEGEDWRKAIADFSGLASSAKFFEEFEAWIATAKGDQDAAAAYLLPTTPADAWDAMETDYVAPGSATDTRLPTGCTSTSPQSPQTQGVAPAPKCNAGDADDNSALATLFSDASITCSFIVSQFGGCASTETISGAGKVSDLLASYCCTTCPPGAPPPGPPPKPYQCTATDGDADAKFKSDNPTAPVSDCAGMSGFGDKKGCDSKTDAGGPTVGSLMKQYCCKTCPPSPKTGAGDGSDDGGENSETNTTTVITTTTVGTVVPNSATDRHNRSAWTVILTGLVNLVAMLF